MINRTSIILLSITALTACNSGSDSIIAEPAQDTSSTKVFQDAKLFEKSKREIKKNKYLKTLIINLPETTCDVDSLFLDLVHTNVEYLSITCKCFGFKLTQPNQNLRSLSVLTDTLLIEEEVLLKFKNLERLRLLTNQTHFVNLKLPLTLRSLVVHGKFKDLPEFISFNNQIAYLEISSDSLNMLPDRIANLTTLKVLNVQNTALGERLITGDVEATKYKKLLEKQGIDVVYDSPSYK